MKIFNKITEERAKEIFREYGLEISFREEPISDEEARKELEGILLDENNPDLHISEIKTNNFSTTSFLSALITGPLEAA